MLPGSARCYMLSQQGIAPVGLSSHTLWPLAGPCRTHSIHNCSRCDWQHRNLAAHSHVRPGCLPDQPMHLQLLKSGLHTTDNLPITDDTHNNAHASMHASTHKAWGPEKRSCCRVTRPLSTGASGCGSIAAAYHSSAASRLWMSAASSSRGCRCCWDSFRLGARYRSSQASCRHSRTHVTHTTRHTRHTPCSPGTARPGLQGTLHLCIVCIRLFTHCGSTPRAVTRSAHQITAHVALEFARTTYTCCPHQIVIRAHAVRATT